MSAHTVLVTYIHLHKISISVEMHRSVRYLPFCTLFHSVPAYIRNDQKSTDTRLLTCCLIWICATQ